MKSHIVKRREPVPAHLDLESRRFPAGYSIQGVVECNRCSTIFDYLRGPPKGWEYVEAAGYGSYNCPRHAIGR